MKNRRDILRLGSAASALPVLASLGMSSAIANDETKTNTTDKEKQKGEAMKVQYLEIVSPDVDEICKTYEAVHGVKFGDPVASLGNARTAKLEDGGVVGVRGPLRSNEDPVVRPYFLVEDIKQAVANAEKAGAKIALPPMELPGQGTCAIFILGGAEHGLWQK